MTSQVCITDKTVSFQLFTKKAEEVGGLRLVLQLRSQRERCLQVLF